jgi:hypothetical protein
MAVEGPVSRMAEPWIGILTIRCSDECWPPALKSLLKNSTQVITQDLHDVEAIIFLQLVLISAVRFHFSAVHPHSP